MRPLLRNEPDNDHTNTPTATQIGRLFLLSFDWPDEPWPNDAAVFGEVKWVATLLA